METLKLDHAQLVTVIAALVPAPTDREIECVMNSEKSINPHNDSYKQKRRGSQEIAVSLRVKEAVAILDEVYRQTIVADATVNSLRR